MEELKVLKSNALEAFQNADQAGKTLLSNLLGKKHFFSKITERVFTFEDACRENESQHDAPFFTSLRPHENARRKMEEVALALNEGVELSLSNPAQQKWYVYVIWDPKISGFRLNGVYYDITLASAGLGSRLAFASRELAEHFAKYFMPLINESLS